LKNIEYIEVKKPETNIVNIYLKEGIKGNIIDIVKHLQDNHNLLVLSFDRNSYIRAVFHHQVSREQTINAIDAFKKTIACFI
jgi:hypothetical protein